MASEPTRDQNEISSSDARERRSIRSRRPAEIRSGITLVYIYNSSSSSSINNKENIPLPNASNHCHILHYTKLSKWLRYIKQARSYERMIIVLVIDDSHINDKGLLNIDINQISRYQQVHSILVIHQNNNINSNEKGYLSAEAKNHVEKPLVIYSDYQSASDDLQKLIDEVEQLNDGSLAAFSKREKWLKDVRQDFIEFFSTLSYRVIIMTMPYKSDEAKQQLLAESRTFYHHSLKQLKQIDEFSRTYDSSKAINWYTKSSFLYRILNRALRTEDIRALYTFRYFAMNLSACLKELAVGTRARHSTQFCCYRGSRISRKEIEQWDVDTLVATNTFWSTSKDLKVAKMFAGIDLTTDMSPSPSREHEVQYILFEIKIDFTRSPNLIVADVSHLSDFEDEQEMLFDLGAPLYIATKTYDEEHRVWRIQMTSTSEIDKLHRDYVSYVHQRLSHTNGTMLYGNLLAGAFCDFKEAVTYFQRLLKVLPFNDENRPNIYCELGRVYRFMGKYERAIEYFQAALLLQKRSLPQSKFGYGCALSGIAVVYSKMGDLERASALNRRALAIYRTLFPKNHVEVNQILNRLADNLYQQGQYQEAYDLLSEALSKAEKSIEEKIFLTNPRTQLYHTFGLILKALGKRTEALEYVKQALDLREKWSHKHHPYTVQIRDDLRALLAEENDQHASVLESASYILATTGICRRALVIVGTNTAVNRNILVFKSNAANPRLLTTELKEKMKAAPASRATDHTINLVVSFFINNKVFDPIGIYDSTRHGPLYLNVCHGHLFFDGSVHSVSNIEVLINLMNKQRDVIQFKNATIDELASQILSKPSATLFMPFEIECHLSLPSQDLIHTVFLLFDATKKLCQVRVYHIWFQCYVRDPVTDMDSICEIYSVISHWIGTSAFDKIIRSVFVSSHTTDLLSGILSDNCNFDLIRSNVQLVQLKIATGQYEEKAVDESDMRIIYSTLKSVPLQHKQQMKTVVNETIEFNAGPILREETLLKKLCEMSFVLKGNKQIEEAIEPTDIKTAPEYVTPQNIIPPKTQQQQQPEVNSALQLTPSPCSITDVIGTQSEETILIRNDHDNIRIVCLNMIMPEKLPFPSYWIKKFQDDFKCVSYILSVKDKIIFLITSSCTGEYIVPLIHQHFAIEGIFLKNSTNDTTALNWVSSYLKIHGCWDDTNELYVDVGKHVETVKTKPLRWHRSEKLFTMFLSQNLNNDLTSAIKPHISVSCDACIVIFHCEHEILFHANGGRSYIQEFTDFITCSQFITEQAEERVFFIVSGRMASYDFEYTLNSAQIHAIYYFHTSEEKYPTDRKRISGYFDKLKSLHSQLCTDLRFYEQYQFYIPRVELFTKSASNEKLTFTLNDKQIDFLSWQLFIDILTQIPSMTNTLDDIVEECNGLLVETSSSYHALLSIVSNENKQTHESILLFSQIILHFHRCDKLYSMLTDIMNRVYNSPAALSTSTIYRAQIISKKDLQMLQCSRDGLVSISIFFLASRSLPSARAIARHAVDNGLTSILFEIEILEGTHLVWIDCDRVVLRLGAIFQLRSIDLAYDGIWYAKIRIAESEFYTTKEQLQFETKIQLSWLTFGNYLCALNRFSQAQMYYTYLLKKLPTEQPERPSLYNNIGLMYTTNHNKTEAIKFYKLALIRAKSSGASTNNTEHQPQSQDQHQTTNNVSSSFIDLSIVYGNMGDVYCEMKNYQLALRYYEEAMKLSTQQRFRRHYQYSIATVLNLLNNSNN